MSTSFCVKGNHYTDSRNFSSNEDGTLENICNPCKSNRPTINPSATFIKPVIKPTKVPELLKCTRGNHYKHEDQFVLKSNGTREKICLQCKEARKCIHKKRKEYCIECNGSQVCEHKHKREFCVKCKQNGKGGSALCEHFKNKSTCMECYNEGNGGHGICNQCGKRNDRCICH